MMLHSDFLKKSCGFIMFSLLAVLLVQPGCSSDDVAGTDGHGVVDLRIEPQEATFSAEEQEQFQALLLDADGNAVDPEGLDVTWEWWSSDTEVFTVEPGGLATGQAAGEAYCIIEVTVLEGTQNFNGRDSAVVFIF
jgi:hypothetical protein